MSQCFLWNCLFQELLHQKTHPHPIPPLENASIMPIFFFKNSPRTSFSWKIFRFIKNILFYYQVLHSVESGHQFLLLLLFPIKPVLEVTFLYVTFLYISVAIRWKSQNCCMLSYNIVCKCLLHVLDMPQWLDMW